MKAFTQIENKYGVQAKNRYAWAIEKCLDMPEVWYVLPTLVKVRNEMKSNGFKPSNNDGRCRS